MKNLLFTLLCILCLAPAFAQFKLTGKILNNHADTIYLNIPLVYGYYRSNNLAIPINTKGYFKADINIRERKFATINHQGIKTTLLLKPGKTLSLVLNTADSSIRNFAGSAAPENKLIYRLRLNETPFFEKYPFDKNPYRKLTADEVQEKIFKPVLSSRDRKLQIVSSSHLILKDKALLCQEINAESILHQLSYARGLYKFKKQQEFFDMLTGIFSHAALKPEVLPAGPLYYTFADQYVGNLEALAFADYQTHPATDHNKIPLKFYGISLDSANNLIAKNGKLYLNWLAIRNNYPRNIAEPLLVQFVAQKCDEKLLPEVLPLMADMKKLYPESRYLPLLTTRVNNLQKMLISNSNNPDIQLVKSYDQITSIYQVISQLKGKVIYLDVWGTWCPPCKQELAYVPQLKHHFKDKDVVYLYLDLDEDQKDGNWREFLKVNGLTGLHLRKNKNTIKPFWDELITDKEKQQRYPTYFIFDKTGKLVKADAKRPSDQAELYKQIEQYL